MAIETFTGLNYNSPDEKPASIDKSTNTKQMNTLTYKLDNEAELPLQISDTSIKLLERFNELEQKFDNVIAAFSTIGEKSTTKEEKVTTAAPVKEVKKNVF